MSGTNYDAIVIGAGSVGLPIAYYLTLEGLRVLVLDSEASPGQGQNKAAIGGVRATHSDGAKITLCLQSLEFYSTFEEKTGIDLGWVPGGYCFPVYREDGGEDSQGHPSDQKSNGLNIDWYGPEQNQGARSRHQRERTFAAARSRPATDRCRRSSTRRRSGKRARTAAASIISTSRSRGS